MSYDLKSEDDVKEYIKNLGTEYRFGCYNEKKPEVCHLLGDYLEAISKDFEKAGRVYKSNCDDYSYPKSCYKTANYMIAGRGGFQPSREKGLEYYEKGCQLGDANSCFRSGVLNILNSRTLATSETYLKGVGQLRESCEGGSHADACHHLSSVFMGSEEDNSTDESKKAAVTPSEVKQAEGAGKSGGNRSAVTTVPRDMGKAFKYALRACQLGSVFACANVSLMYRRGDGVEQDPAKSDSYKQKALELKRDLENRRRSLNFQEGLKPI